MKLTVHSSPDSQRASRQVVKIIYRLLDEERKYVPYHQVKEEKKAA